MNKDTLVIAADFETVVYDGQESTEVWAAAYSVVGDGTERVIIRHYLKDFMKDMNSFRRNAIVYFHNLKFDGTFIIDWLMHNGYKWFYCEKDDKKKMPPKTFTALISAKNRFYSIKVKTSNYKEIEFRDSAKLLPFTLRAAAKAFKTKHSKLEMEYKGKRFAGCKITPDEEQYINNDVLVLKELIEILIKNGMTRLTIGSVCVADFKDNYDDFQYKAYFPDLRRYALENDEIQINNLVNAEEYVRKTYKGAWCYCKNPGTYFNGATYDVNSLYPSIMHSRSGNYYPVGYPHFFKGEIPKICARKDVVWFVRLKARFKLKDGYLPTLQIKNSLLYKPNKWLTTSDFEYRGKYFPYITKNGERYEAYPELYLTFKDYELFMKHYDVWDCEILDGCWFTGELGLFDEYIDKWFERKQTAENKVNRNISKLYLNNLYGKLATSDDASYMKPYLDEDDVVQFNLIESHDKDVLYIPCGSMVTSYARFFTITAAQKNYDLFIYADTDSIHCIDKEVKGIVEHPSDLLCWKKESRWRKGIYIRQKVYAEFVNEEDGEKVYPSWKITCAGMPEKAKKQFLATHPITDFKYGLCIEKGRLKPKRIKGGVILVEEPFTLRKN